MIKLKFSLYNRDENKSFTFYKVIIMNRYLKNIALSKSMEMGCILNSHKLKLELGGDKKMKK